MIEYTMGETSSKKSSCLNRLRSSWKSPRSILSSTVPNRNDNVLRNTRILCGFCMRTPARKAWSNDNDRFKVRILFLGERFFCLGAL